MPVKESIQDIRDRVYNAPPPKPGELLLPSNPLLNVSNNVRPLSASMEGSAYGDEAKGHATQEWNSYLIDESPSGKLLTVRYNGGRNAGHEIYINGQAIALHQLPVGATQEGATAIMGKGMAVHPDVVIETQYVLNKLGTAKLPGELIIDRNASMQTDLEAAYESRINTLLGIKGSTGSGIAQTYSAELEKRKISVGQFVDQGWEEIFKRQYRFYAELMGGTDALKDTLVNVLGPDGTRQKRTVGTEDEYIDRLASIHGFFEEHVEDARPVIEDIWENHHDIGVSFEGAQGPGIDPYYGIYPDVTASRPIARIGIEETTEGVVVFDNVAMRGGAVKQPYMSIVGSKEVPFGMPEELAAMYREENSETGRSTGRPRDLYPIDLEAIRYFQQRARYDHLAVTHLDSNFTDRPIEVVTHYKDKETGQVQPYRPYQWHMDRLRGVTTQLPSWDGTQAAEAETVEDLPVEARYFLKFMSEVIAPVAMGTNGPEKGKVIFMMPK
jgi:adenylosuccinate synthase